MKLKTFRLHDFLLLLIQGKNKNEIENVYITRWKFLKFIWEKKRKWKGKIKMEIKTLDYTMSL